MPRPTETELKFLLSPEAAAELWLHPALRAPGRTQRLRSVYFDTPGRGLHLGRMALRIRETGKKKVQTLKHYAGDSAFSRGEWETEVQGDGIDTAALSNTPAAKALKRDKGKLEPVFVTEVERRIRHCTADAALIEVGFDVGELSAGDRHAPIHEVELELKRGDPSALFILARRLAADIDIRLSFESKSERGYRLDEGAELEPRGAEPPELDPGTSAASAFKALSLSCLGQAAANADILSGHSRPEALHQLRVGLRRLRAVIKAFEPIVAGQEADAVDAELEWLAGELDEARDLDVLMSESYRSALRRLPPDGLAALGRRLIQARTEAYERAVKAVQSRRCAQLWLETAAWIETGAWARYDDPVSASARALDVRSFACEALDHLRKVVLKRAARWPRLDARGRHKLRIRAKRLRYVAELVLPLFRDREKKIRSFRKALRQMQTCLGQLNDITGARDRALAAAGAESPELGFALGRVVGWREAEEPALRKAAERALKTFRRAEPFWRAPS